MRGRHLAPGAPAPAPGYIRRVWLAIPCFGAGMVVQSWITGLDVPHFWASGAAFAVVFVLGLAVHFVHELVATVDGVRYEMGQRRLVGQRAERDDATTDHRG